MSLKFEWDARKAVSNLSKHGVSFQEALTPFADRLARIFDDEREKNMKKTSSRRRPKGEEMRREYRFDYRKSRPNRFATLMKQKTVAVVLDPDVAKSSCARSIERMFSHCATQSTVNPKSPA